MKKIITATAFAALALAYSASAQSVIHIAGAATFRPPVQKAIEDILNPGFSFAWQGSGRYKPNASLYSGTLKSTGAAVIIKTYWTGDVSGVVALSTNTAITKWIANSNTTSTSGTVLTSSYTPETAVPEVTIAVANSTSSAAVVSTAGAAGAAASNTILSANLIDAGSANGAGGAGKVGIVGIEWVLGKLASGFSAPFTNITQAQAAAIISGPTPVAFLTGQPADKNKYIFAVGRSEDAGARTIPFAEAQLGFYTPPLQYQLSFSNNQTAQGDGTPTGGVGATVTGLYFWPANSPLNAAPTLNWNAPGHSGYTLTSDLANALSAVNPVTLSASFTIGTPANPTPSPSNITQAYFVGYNAVADTAALVANGGTALTYNGAGYSEAAVKNGQYSLWAYAHVYYISQGARALTGDKKRAADDLADIIYTADANTNSSGVTGGAGGSGIVIDSSVLVGRDVEGGIIYQTY